MPSLSLSSLFFAIPLYIFVIAPLLRQLIPSDPSSPGTSGIFSNSNNDYDSYHLDDDASNKDEDQLLLNPDLLSLPDNTTTSCPPDTYRIHLLSRTPLIIYIENFLSSSEADHLVNTAKSNYTPSIIYNGQSSALDPSKRLSDRALLPRDNTVRCIENRAAAFQGWKPHLYIERMWAQRYNVSGHYRHHFDWAGSAARGGDRLSTFMVYLSGECEGGGTNFPRLTRPVGEDWCQFIECRTDFEQDTANPDGAVGITFKPIKGNAVFWENLGPDGRGYAETWHAAFPVTKGEKVGLNIWSWYQPPRGRW